MHSAVNLTPSELPEFLLAVAPMRSVFIWGQPGIGKSDCVGQFAAAVGMECVSLLGSQLAPEDLMGVPQIVDGKTRFHPPAMIAREQPYVLFCDELNGATQYNGVVQAIRGLQGPHGRRTTAPPAWRMTYQS